MHGRKKIIVLIHKKDATFFSLHYLIHLLMKQWEETGYTVEVARGPDQLGDADLLIPHIDLTRLPDEYVSIFDRYPQVLNRRLIDISKSRISNAIVEPDCDYTGPVIVKTDRNSGGIPERYLLPEKRSLLQFLPGIRSKAVAVIEHKLRGWGGIETLMEYPVFPSISEVPKGVFENKHLVVERFLPEKVGDQHCLRHHFVCGDRSRDRRVYANTQFIKGASIVATEQLPDSSDVKTYRHQHGLDYGRMDYVVHDGELFVFDINRTPAYLPSEAFFADNRIFLADGILSLPLNAPGEVQ
jgi:hypothetical protein